jgi:hypothetical protein
VVRRLSGVICPRGKSPSFEEWEGPRSSTARRLTSTVLEASESRPISTARPVDGAGSDIPTWVEVELMFAESTLTMKPPSWSTTLKGDPVEQSCS